MTQAPFHIFAAALLLLAVLLVFGQAARFDFVGYDDVLYVTGNDMVLQGLTWESVRQSWTYYDIAQWQPLTFISHMFDIELFGLHAGGHHAMSVAWHALNVLLVYALLMRLTRNNWAAIAVGLLFAVHPYQSEPVSWIASRKDLLYTACTLGTLLLYVEYVLRKARIAYVGALLLAWIALTAKPSAILIPFYLILLDFWPLERAGRAPAWGRFIRATILDKIPFFLMTLAGLLNTFRAGETLDVTSASEVWPLPLRIANAGTVYVLYLFKIFWPSGFTAFYPHPGVNVSIAGAAASFLTLIVIGFIIYRSRGIRPYVFVGWCWFLVALLPVIGLIPIGTQRMADRYMYLALLGPVMAIVMFVSTIERRTVRRWAMAAFAVWIVMLTSMAYRQTAVWRNQDTLWTHAIKVDANNALALNNLGTYHLERGRTSEGLRYLELAATHAPHWNKARGNLGDAYLALGRPADAVPQFEAVLSRDGLDARALNSLGVALLQLGRNMEALNILNRLVQFEPESSEYRYHLGLACMATDDMHRAQSEFQAALKIDPNFRPAQHRLAEMSGANMRQ